MSAFYLLAVSIGTVAKSSMTVDLLPPWLDGASVRMNGAKEITCRLLELISSGSAPEVIAELFSESADWSIPGAPELAPWVGSRTGRESIANFYREFGNHIEPLRFDISAIVADAD